MKTIDAPFIPEYAEWGYRIDPDPFGVLSRPDLDGLVEITFGERPPTIVEFSQLVKDGVPYLGLYLERKGRAFVGIVPAEGCTETIGPLCSQANYELSHSWRLEKRGQMATRPVLKEE